MRSRFAVTLLTAALTALAVAVVVGAQSGSPSAKANDSLFAALAGPNEVAPGDRNGRGSFAATFDGGSLCFGLTVKNLAPPAAAHIHRGAAGKDGDVVITLDVPPGGDPGAVGDCTSVPKALRKAILKRPGRYYVNVHTPDFPNGAVRGQLFAKKP